VVSSRPRSKLQEIGVLCREIGPSSYIAAGEIVRVNVPSGVLYQRGKMVDIAKTHGLVRTRRDGLDP
jgi:hypothetical protein